MWTRFLRRCALLMLPILLAFGMVAIIDPYNYFGRHGPVPEQLKLKNLYHTGRTMAFSNMMWKMVEFERTPNPDVILGDSRLSYFDMDALHEATGLTYYNFGIPGGNFQTIDSIFGFVDSQVALHNVYVQTGFRGMNKGIDYDLYSEPRKLLGRPHAYLSNRRVLEAFALNFYSWLFPKAVQYDVVPPNQWQIVLDGERANAGSFEMDSTVFDGLRWIADRCAQQGANLVFVEYPTNPDVQHIYADAGLMQERQEYLRRLRAIAPVIDLDQPGAFPGDRSYWRDPLHLTVEAQRLVVAKVWGQAR